VPTLALEQIEGLLLEEIDDDISALTIDLRTTITANSLATLLSGLADLYKVGVRLDDPHYDPWVTFKYPGGGSHSGSSVELFISQLMIGTPNKVRVVGRSRWIKDIYTMAATLALFLPSPGHESTNAASVTNVKQTVAVTSSAPVPPSPGELLDTLNKNIEMQLELDARLQADRISLSEYIELKTELEKARRDLYAGMCITRTQINK
jgi:hypothetical protein